MGLRVFQELRLHNKSRAKCFEFHNQSITTLDKQWNDNQNRNKTRRKSKVCRRAEINVHNG